MYCHFSDKFLWKLEGLEGTTLVNAGRLVSSTYTMSKEGKINNLSKNTLLGVNLDGLDLEEIPSLDDLGESSINGAPNGAPNGDPNGAPNGAAPIAAMNAAPNAAPNIVSFQIVPTPPSRQFWERGTSNFPGYFTLKNPASGKYLTSSSFPYKLTLQGNFFLIDW